MRIGVISEGHADRAVIMNVIIGITGLDSSDFQALLPEYEKDETDRSHDQSKTGSSYSRIKKECEERNLIDGFLAIEGQEFIVLHIDTAEADRYDVDRPAKNEDSYCENLRNLVIEKINYWLNTDFSSQILYAVAIEEIDAWILTLHENGDSTKFLDPKKRLNRILNKKGVEFLHDPFDHYWKISKDFSKRKQISNESITNRNCSLILFCKEVEEKVLPQLKDLGELG